MIVAAQSKQFTLKDDGHIYFQPDSTNPLPGEVLAVVKKGDSLLQPAVALVEGRDLGKETPEDVTLAVATWLKAHIYTVLEPLFSLVSDETLVDPVKDIALKLFEHTGIVPRGEVEEHIAKLDPEMRKTLRDKKVRLGPLLIFLPDLNKPAAVKLRAILWSLFNETALPAPTPRDGAMSSVVDITTANADFYRAIGYPLYGPRVIRIDMLDRVINAIYDTAKEGKFQAQHKMAEWMGCPIADLYAILEAMGHRHIVKPPEEKGVEENAVVVAEELVSSIVPEDAVTAPVVEHIVSAEVAETKKPEQKKPELDWFFLRRGKAHVAQATRPQRPARFERNARSENEAPKADKPQFPKERYEPKGQKKKFDDENRSKFNNKKHEDKKRDHKSAHQNPRVYSADASVSDNPFAVLQGLKLK
jgi:ATP-dependent RNA helicase SUPV3L1/SUV3